MKTIPLLVIVMFMLFSCGEHDDYDPCYSYRCDSPGRSYQAPLFDSIEPNLFQVYAKPHADTFLNDQGQQMVFSYLNKKIYSTTTYLRTRTFTGNTECCKSYTRGDYAICPYELCSLYCYGKPYQSQGFELNRKRVVSFVPKSSDSVVLYKAPSEFVIEHTFTSGNMTYTDGFWSIKLDSGSTDNSCIFHNTYQLKGKTFNSVFELTTWLTDTDRPLTKKIFFNRESGILAYQYTTGERWVRKE